MLLKQVGPLKRTSKGPAYLATKALEISLEPERSKLRHTLGLLKRSLHLSPAPKPCPGSEPLPYTLTPTLNPNPCPKP
jgi:hypothetical protein